MGLDVVSSRVTTLTLGKSDEDRELLASGFVERVNRGNDRPGVLDEFRRLFLDIFSLRFAFSTFTCDFEL